MWRVTSKVALAMAVVSACSAPPPAAAPAPAPALRARASPPAERPPVAAAAVVPLTASTSCAVPALREAVLRRINLERARRQQCGGKSMAPASPLSWNDQLFSAAARHSADMARHDYFDHINRRGERVGERASAEGYPWRNIGENIAAGDRTLEAVMTGWMRSAGHCSNIMTPAFTEVAVACVNGTEPAKFGTYWTMVLGGRR